jgi:hypothetical protein
VVSTVEFSGAVWRKSSRSGGGANDACVEVAVADGAVGVRDSKNVGSGHLVFGGAAWEAFTGGVLASQV